MLLLEPLWVSKLKMPLQILAQHKSLSWREHQSLTNIKDSSLQVPLADGQQVLSTHMCNIINVLPVTLMGHIIPDFSIVSLFGIRVLTKAGCKITFDDQNFTIRYNGNIIFGVKKDLSMDLWTLPLGLPTSHPWSTKPSSTHGSALANNCIETTQVSFLRTPCGIKQIAFGLHINLSAAPAYPHYWKQYIVVTSKGAKI